MSSRSSIFDHIVFCFADSGGFVHIASCSACAGGSSRGTVISAGGSLRSSGNKLAIREFCDFRSVVFDFGTVVSYPGVYCGMGHVKNLSCPARSLCPLRCIEYWRWVSSKSNHGKVLAKVKEV